MTRWSQPKNDISSSISGPNKKILQVSTNLKYQMAQSKMTKKPFLNFYGYIEYSWWRRTFNTCNGRSALWLVWKKIASPESSSFEYILQLILVNGAFPFIVQVHIALIPHATCWYFSILIVGALCFAELGTMIPKSGGTYVYVMESMGPIPAFLFSWTCALILMPASVSAIALSFGYYMTDPLYPHHDCEEKSRAMFDMVSKLFACLCICKYFT